MNNRDRATSMGTVIALGFIVLGILNLIGFSHFNRTRISTVSRIPGILFILTGITIIIIKMTRKPKDK